MKLVLKMERDAGISHGASRFLQERLKDAADAYTTSYCKTCGTIANNLAKQDTYSCRLCGKEANFGSANIPYTFKLLSHFLNGLGYFMHFTLQTEEENRTLQELNQKKIEEKEERKSKEETEEEIEGLDTDLLEEEEEKSEDESESEEEVEEIDEEDIGEEYGEDEE